MAEAMTDLGGVHRVDKQWEFRIPGKPVSWKRTGTGAGYKRPRKQERDFVKLVRQYAMAAGVQRAPFPVCVFVAVICYWPRPKKKPAWMPDYMWDTGVRIRRPTRNRDDADRLAGLVLDALHDHQHKGRLVPGIGWEDDGQVCPLLVDKFYCSVPGEEHPEPHMHITIQWR